VDNGLDVFVADYNNQRLLRYDKDLNFISSYSSGEALDDNLRFGYPAALAFSAQGELFVADHEFNRVLRFEALGSPKASFGDFNWGEGRLARPAKIFISRRNEIWVSDSLKHALMRYDAFGNFLGSVALGESAAPSGLAEWAHGMIVADRKQHALLFLNHEGERLGEFGKRGSGANAFEAPAAVVLLNGNAAKARPDTAHILVLDSGNNRVQKFEVQWLH
jgi:sugar lactone lactonase YvrE